MAAASATSCPPRKLALASALARTPWPAAARRLEALWPLVRVVNWHGVPARHASGFAAQLDLLARRYEVVDPFALEDLLAGGPGRRPAAVLTFDDGLANHLEVVAPLLAARGLRGIFCIPGEFQELPPADARAWHRERVYPSPTEEHRSDDDVRPLGWGGVRELAARGHRICCHTQAHRRIHPGLDAAGLQREIVEARAVLEARLGGTVQVDGFCWPVAFDPAAEAADRLVRATYAYALVGDTRPLRAGHDPFRVHRVNLEASWPVEAVELQLSGIADLVFALRRARGRLPGRSGVL